MSITLACLIVLFLFFFFFSKKGKKKKFKKKKKTRTRNKGKNRQTHDNSAAQNQIAGRIRVGNKTITSEQGIGFHLRSDIKKKKKTKTRKTADCKIDGGRVLGNLKLIPAPTSLFPLPIKKVVARYKFEF